MNVGIFLKQFKRSNQAIIEDIRRGNAEPYGAEPLREMMKLLPEADEVTKMKAYHGDVAKLSLADSFVFLLIQLPSYATRIECMLAKEEIPGTCEAARAHIGVLRCATKEVLGCQELHAVLHLVLQAGNILNAGGHGGNAAGFKLSSLLSLADTKANKPGMNMLHFVAQEAQKTDEKLLDFPLELSHIQAASRISLETLDAELQRLTSRTRSLEVSVGADGELLRQLESFLQDTTARLRELRDSRELLSKEADELMDFFCEDSDTFRLDDCFSVLYGFCCKFGQAAKENKEREARRHRLQVQEEQKRHSWAGGEEVGSAMRYHCSSETDLSAVMLHQDETSVLLELLSPKSTGRRASRRRSRRSSSQSPSSPSGNTATTTTPSATNLECRVKTDTPSDLDDNYRDRREASLTRRERRHCKTSSEDDHINRDITAAADDNDALVFVLETCSLVPELKAFGEVTVTDAEEPQTSDESIGAQPVVSWCVTALCEVDRPGEKEAASFPEPAQSLPVRHQPSPTSTLCVSSPTPPRSDQRKKAASSRTVPTSANKSQPSRVRTLNSSEKQIMRKVVPVSKTSLEKRGEKPSTGPSSQRSSLQSRDSKNRHVPGARNQPEEKMCRSTLRALGGGSNVKAANTPSPAPSSGPGFARNTASSSFRQTLAGLPKVNVSKSGSEASSKSSTSAERPRTSSSLSSSVPKRSLSSRTAPGISTTPRSGTPPSAKTSPNIKSHPSVRTSPNNSTPQNVSTPPNIRPRPSVSTSTNIRTPPKVRTSPNISTPPNARPHSRVRISANIRTPPIINTAPRVRTSAKTSTPPNNSAPPNARPHSTVGTSENIRTPPMSRTPPSVRASTKIRTPPSVGTSAKIRTPPGSTGADSVAPAKGRGRESSFSDRSSQSRQSAKVSKPSWR
ncbi:FH2 domain-containing protein 1-like [Syngnathoides biaculeatus]|uniref:FH2 domain-containing protein 1-like n=1 Tax=Syngnathoides biaculeatus TaxID=300417 RepID=UPI002ADE2135|nr:FH2 domain-containing protein 1-like [Syngnathoides biaculeatus]